MAHWVPSESSRNVNGDQNVGAWRTLSMVHLRIVVIILMTFINR